MKRDILIFPKFKNIEIIQNIRNKYDHLASLIPPHITLVFPFSDNISNEELLQLIRKKLKDIKPFSVKFQNLAIDYDPFTLSNYIYLKCTEGYDKLCMLHDLLYTIYPLSSHLNSKVEYIPHITLGQKEVLDFELCEIFECDINEIVVEEIGKNEESIIIDKIKIG